jgi:hypothetical protein
MGRGSWIGRSALNGVPDECEDGNGSGVADACHLICETGDCASDPLGRGTREDCQPNGVPDECELTWNDCNGNDIPDECDIADRTSTVCDGDGIADECECLGDIFPDGEVNLVDSTALLLSYGMTGGAEYRGGDLDGDGDVDLADLAALLAVYGTTCP